MKRRFRSSRPKTMTSIEHMRMREARLSQIVILMDARRNAWLRATKELGDLSENESRLEIQIAGLAEEAKELRSQLDALNRAAGEAIHAAIHESVRLNAEAMRARNEARQEYEAASAKLVDLKMRIMNEFRVGERMDVVRGRASDLLIQADRAQRQADSLAFDRQTIIASIALTKKHLVEIDWKPDRDQGRLNRARKRLERQRELLRRLP